MDLGEWIRALDELNHKLKSGQATFSDLEKMIEIISQIMELLKKERNDTSHAERL